MSSSFVHLHTHTEYSMLDGASRVSALVEAAAADGQPALGITDHGNMYGVVEFYKACRDAGVKPVLGLEAYMAREHRSERPARTGRVDDTGGNVSGSAQQKLYYHLTLLAETTTGYKNLIQIASRAFLEGFHYKPRCDWEMLAEHSEGVISTSGCLGGQVPQALLNGSFDDALERAGRLQDIFGKESFFVELQDHGIRAQHEVNPQLIDIASRLGAPLLVTNDSHYTCESDAEAHDALLCVQTGARLDDKDRFRFHGTQHYLKSAAEMRHLFSDHQGACDSSLLIAERADVEIAFGQDLLPRFPLPEGEASDDAYLRRLTLEGAAERWGDNFSDIQQQRIDFELGVISEMGFAAYFLIVWDLVRHARERGIRVGPGRGSAAGSAVAYCLRITDLDPIEYDLLFERFLNPDRVSMPDIDLDFDTRRRGEMLEYTAKRYGREHVAQIVTFSMIKAKAAVRDAARVLGFPPRVGDRVANAVPGVILGRSAMLSQCFEKQDGSEDIYTEAAPLRELVKSDTEAERVVGVARGLEGLRRQDGIHAAAVVIAPGPLTEYLPVQRKPDPDLGEAAPLVTQYEMHSVEELGLLKMDFLGLRNLDVITDCVEWVERTRGEVVPIDNPPLDDEATFELLQRSDTQGVFQLESEQMRALMRALAPTTIHDVCALVALYRPGPMAANMHIDYADRKNGRQPVSFFHADAADVLEDTYGLMIYQESVMRVAQRFAGYTLAEADILRKAMGKKSRSVMASEKPRFMSGMAASGYHEGLAEELWNTIAEFADYAFNKSHSYGYGFVAYQTAYLKANYPVEFFAALLSSISDTQTLNTYTSDAQQRGISILPPDINRSDRTFTPLPDVGEHGAIVYGLGAVKRLGAAFADAAIGERVEGGRYESFADYVTRSAPEALNKGSLEALISVGGFDSLGHSRRGLLSIREQAVQIATRQHRDDEAGIMSLFASTADDPSDGIPPVPDIAFSQAERLTYEKELLGCYVSGHPLGSVSAASAARASTTVSALLEMAPQARNDPAVCVLGVVGAYKERVTRKGDKMATLSLEDQQAVIDAVIFPRQMADCDTLRDGLAVLVKGRIETEQDTNRLVVESAEPAEMDSEGTPAAAGRWFVDLRGWAGVVPDGGLESLRAAFQQHPGDSQIALRIDQERVALLPDQYKVRPSDDLDKIVAKIVGAAAT